MTCKESEDAWRQPIQSAPAVPPAGDSHVDPDAVRVAQCGAEGALLGPAAGRLPALQSHPRRSEEILSLMESHGLSGAWSWTFEADDHAWSPGCFHLLGVDPRATRPHYGLLLDLVHPEDRADMARPAELIRGETRSVQTFRVIRPDGTMRFLCARTEVKLGGDGNPRSALGTLLDVTDRERGIKAQTWRSRQTLGLSRKARLLWFSLRQDLTFDFEPEAASLLGCPPASLDADPFAAVEPGARAALYRAMARHRDAGTEMQCGVVLHPPGGTPRPCQIVMIPPFDGDPAATSAGLVQVTDVTRPDLPEGDAGRDDTLRGFHLRAARALLDWSMHDLAAESGLSLSTVRRLETEDDMPPGRSRPRAVSALRRAGVRFTPLADGTIAVSRGL